MGLVHYIAKFTISRFIISSFECTTIYIQDSSGRIEHCMIHDFSWRLMSSIFPLTQQIAASLENLSIYKLHNVCIVGTPPSSIEYSLNNAK